MKQTVGAIKEIFIERIEFLVVFGNRNSKMRTVGKSQPELVRVVLACADAPDASNARTLYQPILPDERSRGFEPAVYECAIERNRHLSLDRFFSA